MNRQEQEETWEEKGRRRGKLIPFRLAAGTGNVCFCHVKAGAPTGMIRYRSERRLTFTAIQHDMLLYKEIGSQLFTVAASIAATVTATDVLHS